MSKSYEYNKEYAKKWNAEHTRMFSVRLNKDAYEKIETYCKENNISKSQLLKERLSDIID